MYSSVDKICGRCSKYIGDRCKGLLEYTNKECRERKEVEKIKVIVYKPGLMSAVVREVGETRKDMELVIGGKFDLVIIDKTYCALRNTEKQGKACVKSIETGATLNGIIVVCRYDKVTDENGDFVRYCYKSLDKSDIYNDVQTVVKLLHKI